MFENNPQIVVQQVGFLQRCPRVMAGRHRLRRQSRRRCCCCWCRRCCCCGRCRRGRRFTGPRSGAGVRAFGRRSGRGMFTLIIGIVMTFASRPGVGVRTGGGGTSITVTTRSSDCSTRVRISSGCDGAAHRELVHRRIVHRRWRQHILRHVLCGCVCVGVRGWMYFGGCGAWFCVCCEGAVTIGAAAVGADWRIYDDVARAHGTRTRLTLYYEPKCVRGDEIAIFVCSVGLARDRECVVGTVRTVQWDRKYRLCEYNYATLPHAQYANVRSTSRSTEARCANLY